MNDFLVGAGKFLLHWFTVATCLALIWVIVRGPKEGPDE